VVVDRPCGRAPHCALHQAWDRARDALVSELAGMTVADLVEAGAR
jgi:DNA-binding IscR family transcriptional regulator